jgi:hypothetical protein
MKYAFLRTAAACISSLLFFYTVSAQDTQLRIILIRHAEKPQKGDNLTCQGLNRSLELPHLLYTRFGLPTTTYIPAMALGDSTKHSRMFQTIIPFAVKYNLPLTSKFLEDDSTAMAQEIIQKKGTVLVIWEHKRIPPSPGRWASTTASIGPTTTTIASGSSLFRVATQG